MENVIIPTLQLGLKVELYSLFDEVEKLENLYTNELQKNVINKLKSSIIMTVTILPKHDLLSFAYYIARKDNREKQIIQARALKNYEDLGKSNIPEIKNLNTKYFFLVKKAFLVCSGAMIIYFTPFLLIYKLIKEVAYKLGFYNRSKYETTIKKSEKKITEYQQFEKQNIKHSPSGRKNKLEPVYC